VARTLWRSALKHTALSYIELLNSNILRGEDYLGTSFLWVQLCSSVAISLVSAHLHAFYSGNVVVVFVISHCICWMIDRVFFFFFQRKVSDIIFYQMLVGFVPFRGDSPMEIFEAVLRANLRFSTHVFCSISPTAKDLLRRMLCKELSRRFSIEQVLSTSHWNLLPKLIIINIYWWKKEVIKIGQKGIIRIVSLGF